MSQVEITGLLQLKIRTLYSLNYIFQKFQSALNIYINVELQKLSAYYANDRNRSFHSSLCYIHRWKHKNVNVRISRNGISGSCHYSV